MPAVLSYSFLDSFENCRKQAHEVYILKSVPRFKESAQEGIEIHEALAKRIAGGAETPHASAERLVQSLERRGKAQTEVKLGVTRELEACDFFSKVVWLRGVVDVLLLGRGDADRPDRARSAFIGDWKTGKVREKDLQLQIFAALVFANYPEVENVRAVNLWLREPDLKMQPRDWSRDRLPGLWAQILRLADHVEESERSGSWPARVNALCGWCQVVHCEFHPGRK